MNSARSAIFAAIRDGLKSRNDAAAKVGVETRLAQRTPNLVPERARPLGRKAAVEQFTAMATEASATVVRVKAMLDVPNLVIDFLRSHNLPMRAAIAPDPALDAARWSRRKTLELRRGPAEPFDEVGIGCAFRAIAETGTLMLASGPHSPTTLSFLPETHIVILFADRILGGYEEGFAALRDAAAAAAASGTNGAAPASPATAGPATAGPAAGSPAPFMPRTVNFITGPSRSADIEQHLQLGAHGQRRLHIVIVDEQASAAPQG